MEPKTSQITPEVDFPHCYIDYHFAKGIFLSIRITTNLGRAITNDKSRLRYIETII